MSHHSAARLAQAEKAADEARLNLGETLNEIQEKFSPSNILTETSRGLKEKGMQITDNLIDSISSRPILATVAASGIGWLLSRKPGLALLLKLFLGGSATSRRAAHSNSSNTQRSRRDRSRRRSAGVSEETA